MASFTYSKLPPKSDTTRMFRLFPHKDRNAQIRGELIDYDLSDAGGRSHLYEALSYVWYDGEGSTDRDSQSIILNDCIFSVTPNLYAALLRLRNHQLERALWIDAVCINQSDDDEKQEQIPLMRTIYAQASRVIVWLGEARSNSDEALENIRRLAGDSVNDGPASDRYHNYTSATDGPSTAKSVMIDHDACEMLFKRNWFRRIWVLQEVGVARYISIICGHVEMNGYTFWKGFSRLNLSSSILSHVHPVIHLMRDAILRPKYQHDSRGTLFIGELIDRYRTHDATVQHDKVYALLGLSADDPKTPALKPDYASPWNDVFVQLTTYLLGEKCLVQTWPDRDIAVIKGKGWILGYVNSSRSRTPEDGRESLTIEFIHTAGWMRDSSSLRNQWTLRTPAELVQVGDIICLLQGATRPSIIRLCRDHFKIVMTTITPHNGERTLDLNPQEWDCTSDSLYNILLTWGIPRAGAKNDVGLQDPVELRNIAPEYQECPYEAKTRFNDMVLIVNKIIQRTLSSGIIFGTGALERILVQCTGNFPFSEEVVKEAASSDMAGRKAVELLIQHHGENLPITDDVIKAAAKKGRPETLQCLLSYRGNRVPIPEDVVEAATKNCRRVNLPLLLHYQRESIGNSKEGAKAATANTDSSCMIT